jgi:hypothetical protein
MGEETSQPEVEESTEPPIGSSPDEGPLRHQPSPEHAPVAAQQLQHYVSAGLAEKQPDSDLVAPELTPPAAPQTASAGECKWVEQYQYAHTFPPSEIARILDVDLQYGPPDRFCPLYPLSPTNLLLLPQKWTRQYRSCISPCEGWP